MTVGMGKIIIPVGITFLFIFIAWMLETPPTGFEAVTLYFVITCWLDKK